jgi:hypothetical protein
MLTSTPADRIALIQEGTQLLSKKVYSVAELEDFRKKAGEFREKVAKLLGAEAAIPSLPTSPEDILDWVTFEKASVQLAQDALAHAKEA